MASSGTTSLSIDFRHRPAFDQYPRDSVFMAGRATIKSTAVLEADVLRLRTIKNFIATPYYLESAPDAKGRPVLYGSVTVAGSLMNNVTLRVLKGSVNPVTGGVGTAHLGTLLQGTLQIGFFAVGA